MTLLAIDGHVTAEIFRQLEDLPENATHLLVSSGGNDALRNAHLLQEQVNTVGDAMDLFPGLRTNFQRDYESMLSQISRLSCSVAVCTVYDTIPQIGQNALTALSIFNDRILKSAFAMKIPVLDLRLVFSEKSDYSAVSPIEPSATGTIKLVRSIVEMLSRHDFTSKQSVVYI